MNRRAKRIKASLRSRVTLGVALPIFVILTFLSVFHYTREVGLLNEQTRLHAAQLGEMIIRSLNHAMVTKEGQHLFSSLVDISQLEGIAQIQVIGLSGKVLADSRGQATARQLDLDDAECQACHRFPPDEIPTTIAFPQEREGLRVSTPIDNAEQCFACHDDTSSHLGVLLMDISFSGQQELISKDLRVDLLITAISTVLISLGSYYFVHRLVVRRVESFKGPIAEFSNGNFAVRLHESSRVEDELTTFVDIFNQMAGELEQQAKREEERQNLREKAIIEERERIARELHDGLAQVLGYVNTKAMAVRLMLENNRVNEAKAQLQQLEEAARNVFLDVREAILGLKMAGQVGDGFVAAIRDYAAQFSELSGIQVQLDISDHLQSLDLPGDVELHLLRIVQEALSNVRKHSSARRTWVSITQEDHLLKLSVNDDGVGFNQDRLESKKQQHFGLNSMRERADEIGAALRIESEAGTGTRILVELNPNGK